MQLILVISLCAVTAYAQSYANLRFTHPVMGEMKVSTKNYPMLTPVEMPEIVYITPTSEELKAITGTAGRKRRQTIDPAFQSKVRSFLTSEFGNNVTAANLAPIDKSQLPFKSFAMASKFDMNHVPKTGYSQFMKWYQKKLKNEQKKRPWFPAQEIYDQLNICPWVYYSSTGNQDIKFNSDNGGVMAYFKISCILDFPSDTVVFGLGYSGTDFQLEPVAKPTQITQEWIDLMGVTKTTLNTYMYENRSLNAKQIKLLIDFFRGLVLREVRDQFSSYLF
uniref:GLPGLI family protein n=1 Tax=Plectus sambesii TaxID=2011161 RepID=A0A914VVT8_9BILA